MIANHIFLFIFDSNIHSTAVFSAQTKADEKAPNDGTAEKTVFPETNFKENKLFLKIECIHDY